MGIYELPKIQSRGHKLEVHSHVCSDCSFLKKRFSFEQLWQEESLGTSTPVISINLSSMAPQTVYTQITKCVLAMKLQV